MSAKRITGLVFLVLSILGLFYTITTYSNDTSKLFGYNYEEPLSSHETTVVAIGTVSGVGTMVGLCLLCSNDPQPDRKNYDYGYDYGCAEEEKSPVMVRTDVYEELYQELEKLNELKDAGILSEEEFNRLKVRCLEKIH